MPTKNVFKRLSIKNLRKRNNSVANLPEDVASGRANSESPPCSESSLPLPAQNKRNLEQKENPLERNRSQSMYELPSGTRSSISEYGVVITSNLTDIPPVPPIPNALFPEDDILTSIWNFVQNLKEPKKRGKADEVLETAENTVVSAQAAQTNSATTITAVTTGLQNAGGLEAVERGIGYLFEGSQVLMNLLDEVEKLHPFIGVAVIAFKTVLYLAMTRRENDRRILALHFEMKDMMAVLVELKNVKDIDKVAPDGSTIKARMQTLVHETVGDITDCGNTCDAYNKLNIVVQVLGGSIWEERLTKFGVVFNQRRDEFEFALTIHIAKGVDEANLGIQALKQTTEELKSMITEMFRNLAGPEFRKIAAAAEEKGGFKEVRQSHSKIKELTELGPKSASAMVAKGAPSKSEGASKKSNFDKILDDLNTDVDTALRKNETKFRQRFEFQKDEILQGMKQESNRIIDALTAGPHDRIRDEDVREIWKEMAWRGSAKTRHFVNALRDHFSDKWNNKQVNLSKLSSDSTVEAPIGHIFTEDKWALEYLNARNLQQISEVFDDDTSGFVTINEVNSFTTSRPEGWTLPHWVAYWAIGWNMTLQSYQGKLQELMGKMFALLPSIRKENLPKANEYLNGIYIYTATLYNSSYVKIEEDRLRKNLEAFKYDIDGCDTLHLICGKGDIEKFLLPLLYLILARHFEIFRVAQKRVLHAEELPDVQNTVMWIVYEVTLRIEMLKTTFKQQKLDPGGQFESFAHGLFSRWDSSKMWTADRIREMQAPPDRYPYIEESEDQGVEAQKVCNHHLDQDIVDYAAYDDTLFETFETQYNLIESNNAPSSLNLLLGSWTASIYLGPLTLTGCFHIFLEQDSSDNTSSTFKATGKANYGTGFTILGSCRCDEVTGIIHVSFTRSILPSGQDPSEEPSEQFWKGELDIQRETISGKVSFGEEVEDLSTINDQFVMKRMSSVVMRFRPSPAIFGETKARALWTLATAAIHAQVRNRDTWSWAYIKARRDTRNRFVELYIRSKCVGRELQDEEFEEFRIIKGSSTVSDLRFWHSVAQLRLRTTITHSSVFCDACTVFIVGARTICLDCTAHEDHSRWGTVDFCGDDNCSLQEVNHDGLKRPHQPTHDVAKVRRNIHASYAGEIRRHSRAALQQARGFFQQSVQDEEQGKERQKYGRGEPQEASEESQAAALRCLFCESQVKQPCWYCVHCTDGTFICDECDTKGEAALDYARLKHGYKGTHEFYFHDLVRCAERVSGNTEEIITIEERLNQLENQFSSHKETMSIKLNELRDLLGGIASKLESI